MKNIIFLSVLTTTCFLNKSNNTDRIPNGIKISINGNSVPFSGKNVASIAIADDPKKGKVHVVSISYYKGEEMRSDLLCLVMNTTNSNITKGVYLGGNKQSGPNLGAIVYMKYLGSDSLYDTYYEDNNSRVTITSLDSSHIEGSFNGRVIKYSTSKVKSPGQSFLIKGEFNMPLIHY